MQGGAQTKKKEGTVKADVKPKLCLKRTTRRPDVI
jgi:hypothetical protein